MRTRLLGVIRYTELRCTGRLEARRLILAPGPLGQVNSRLDASRSRRNFDTYLYPVYLYLAYTF